LFNTILYVGIDAPKQILKFNVTIPDQNYFAIGFGKSMTNTDMIVWQAQGSKSLCQDWWSTSNTNMPTIDLF
jgi:hypothetical protein